MSTWHEWVQYCQDLHRFIQAQSRKIDTMEKELDSVKTELNSWKDQKRIHIDKIEYKFDQLKVEKLDGTLNIGLTPQTVEDMAVEVEQKSGTDSGDKPAQPTSELQEKINSELQAYLQKDVPKKIEDLEERTGVQLDPWHRKMIQNDLGKQMGQRMMHYLKQLEQGATVDQLSSIKDSVLFRTKHDLIAAIESYFSKMPKEDGEKDELSSK
ncbi:spore gernimation protein [Paenibacillus sp. H1-7]|uniref:spore germination protein GerPC n=1 Tax=Paenibacillus sp. H1-7 TaxID=2282849 RepID=UPI001EF96FDD|nr:spore germination protein GerPC [Paenibacillus sp. H1-7]ULL17252.1 spore gernimation protein [Paenibacillus sp. H1-7]